MAVCKEPETIEEWPVIAYLKVLACQFSA